MLAARFAKPAEIDVRRYSTVIVGEPWPKRRLTVRLTVIRRAAIATGIATGPIETAQNQAGLQATRRPEIAKQTGRKVTGREKPGRQ